MKLVLSLLAIIYFLFPHDLFPDMLLGWGWIDDLLILYLLWRFFYRGNKSNFSFFQNFSNQSRSSSSQQFHHDRSSSEDGQENFGSGSIKKHKDPYEILQVSRNASQEEIRLAYKDLVAKYHPDKVLHLGEEFQQLAEDRFKEIQEAYQKLSHKR